MKDIIYQDGKLYKEVGWISAEGYYKFTLDNRTYYVHRWLYERAKGKLPRHMDVDHINGDKLDNRLENLRAVNRSENAFNRQKANSNSETGVRGVFWHRATQRWQVSIRGNYLGVYPDYEEACKVAEDYYKKSTEA